MRAAPFAFTFAILSFASAASFADLEATTTTTTTTTVTKGNTDVVTDTTAATRQAADKKSSLTELSFNAGGLFAAGNSRSVAVTAGLKSKVKRGDHQFVAAAQANYARSATAVDGSTAGQPTVATVENMQALLRYDWFFAKHWSAFLQTSGRHDRFEGIDFRYQLAPGVAYSIIDEAKVQLVAEAGYDFQFDVRSDEYITNADGTPKLDSDGNPLAKTSVIHNGRLFLGFSDKLFKGVEFLVSLEYLQDLADAGTFRFVFDSAVKANISKSFALATAVTVRYDNNPLPTVVNTDVMTAISLVYNLF